MNNNAETKIGPDDIEWADYIFVMEQAHKKKLRKKFREHLKDQKVICLGIPDKYDYMDDELVKILSQRVPEFLS